MKRFRILILAMLFSVTGCANIDRELAVSGNEFINTIGSEYEGVLNGGDLELTPEQRQTRLDNIQSARRFFGEAVERTQ